MSKPVIMVRIVAQVIVQTEEEAESVARLYQHVSGVVSMTHGRPVRFNAERFDGVLVEVDKETFEKAQRAAEAATAKAEPAPAPEPDKKKETSPLN